MAKHSIGLIGCGSMGEVWTDTVAAHPDCRIALTYDPDLAKAQERAAAAKARAVPELDEVMASPEIDLVIVATPTWTHAAIVQQAAQSGKHVLCEKPMALTVGDCRRMIATCAAAGVELAVGQTLRFWGAFLEVRRRVAQGEIGTPCLAQVQRGGAVGAQPVPKGPPVPTAESLRWRFDTRYSGGDILEGLVHELDFARSVLGEVSGVYCTVTGRQDYGEYQSPRLIQAVVDFVRGGQATVRMGGIVGYSGGGSWVAGTQGTLAFETWDGPVRHYLPGEAEPRLVPCSSTSAYELELRDLLAAIHGEGPPENSGLNGLHNIGLGLALYWSIATGRRVEFQAGLAPEVPEDYQYRGPSAVL